MAITSLSFVHIFPLASGEAAADSLEEGIKLFQFAEQLGYNAGYIRTRHLQHAPAAPAVLQAAIGQRTTKIEIGNACIVGQYENPFNLAEEISLAAALSRGRLRPGLAISPPQGFEAGQEALFYGAGWRDEDYSRDRLNLIRELVGGRKVHLDLSKFKPGGRSSQLKESEEIKDTSPTPTGINAGLFSDQVEPHWPGLAENFWLSSTSVGSATWAAENRWHIINANMFHGPKSLGLTASTTFDEAQSLQGAAYREHAAPGFTGKLAHGRVIVPTDVATSEQAAKYRAYLDERTPRTLAPIDNGDDYFYIRKDSVASIQAILDDLGGDPAFAYADELAVLLPFTFAFEDYLQILEQVATRLAPELGWRPNSLSLGDRLQSAPALV
ncbi:MAG: LLM class flavin-dependent oxidoreductase [Bifidobacteriaceae bacterium]|nr:LLM class flavin-dependent oxidoreductase [Bifidobacteriaceae bacterium]